MKWLSWGMEELRAPYFSENDSGLAEKDDGMHPVAQGCLILGGLKLGCLIALLAVLMFAIVLSRFVAFKN